MNGITLTEAAKQMNRSAATLRRWVQQGAPTVTPGYVGRGHGALVDPAALQRWRYGEVSQAGEAEQVALLAQAFSDFFRHDSGINAPAHRTLGIRDREAAALLATLFEYTARRITGHDLETLPPEIARLRAICVGLAHRKQNEGNSQ